MDNEKTYSDKEIGDILSRAVELQNKDLVLDRSRIKLADLESIAKESGIDPEYVRLALSQPKARSTRKNPGDMPGGMPRLVETSAAIDEDLNADRMEYLSTRISGIMEEPGNLQIVGRTLVWTRDHNAFNMNTGIPFSMIIRNRNGKTLVETRESVGMWAIASIMSIALLSGIFILPIPLFLGLRGLILPAFGLCGLVLGYFAGRAYWKNYWNRRKRKHDRLVSEVLGEIQANGHVDVLS